MRKNELVFLVALALVACPGQQTEEGSTDTGGGSEDLTVVVEADKSQILQQEEKLKADQDSLEKERDRLAKAREDVLSKISSLSKKDRKQRKELEGEQARLAKDEDQLRRKMSSFEKERADLERKKTELIESISALTGKGGNADNLARRISAVERRQQTLLEGQEKSERLLTEIREIVRDIQSSGGGTRTVVVSNPTPPSGGSSPTTASKVQITRIEGQIDAKMRAKGILDADLPPAARDYQTSATKAAHSKDWDAALESLNQVDAIVSSIKVDHAFVQAKFRRINKAYDSKMKSLDDKKKNKVLTLLDDVSDSFSDGRYDRANRKINQIHALLEGR